jgi:RNA polymerase sigma-70 factor (ECF subfamily)
MSTEAFGMIPLHTRSYGVRRADVPSPLEPSAVGATALLALTRWVLGPGLKVDKVTSGAVAPEMGQNEAVDDSDLVAALRAGDEAAFRDVVAKYNPSMMRNALLYVSTRAVAEEVVQETWLAVVKGLDGFEGRSSFKTWVFTILGNRARSRGTRERRSVPFSSLQTDEPTPGVPGDRFLPSTARWPGYWSEPPNRWSDAPAAHLESKETRALIINALRSLPPQQQEVMALRDVEGWSAEDVCSLLAISDGNQRVLLHRARGKVRSVLEQKLASAVTA